MKSCNSCELHSKLLKVLLTRGACWDLKQCNVNTHSTFFKTSPEWLTCWSYILYKWCYLIWVQSCSILSSVNGKFGVLQTMKIDNDFLGSTSYHPTCCNLQSLAIKSSCISKLCYFCWGRGLCKNASQIWDHEAEREALTDSPPAQFILLLIRLRESWGTVSVSALRKSNLTAVERVLKLAQSSRRGLKSLRPAWTPDHGQMANNLLWVPRLCQGWPHLSHNLWHRHRMLPSKGDDW